MSIRDGNLKRKDLYLTNDVSFAAYLMLRGYELLGTVDEGQTNQWGKPIMMFGLMPTDDSILNSPSPMARVETDINDKWDEFENQSFSLLRDPTQTVNLKDFVKHYRACFRALDEAIRKP